MIPLHDDVPSRTTPVVNYALIGVCSLVFLIQLATVDSVHSLIEGLGMIPARVIDPDLAIRFRDAYGHGPHTAAPALLPAFLTPLTCVFLHGGWLHFLGNMWFLWIFGDNVEDCLGHWRYLAFYLGTGIAASLAHLVANSSSTIPTIGASGAIAGVMGAYLLLYPRARVLTLVPILFFVQIMVLPAVFVLGLWFALQFYQGLVSIGDSAGGVAWWAHIGGFIAGYLVARSLRRRQRLRVEVQQSRKPKPKRWIGRRQR